MKPREIADLKTKLRESMSTFNDLNCRIHKIVDTLLMEPGSDTYTIDAELIKSNSDEQEASYRKRNKGLYNKVDDVFKKVADLIDNKKGNAHTSRPDQILSVHQAAVPLHQNIIRANGCVQRFFLLMKASLRI